MAELPLGGALASADGRRIAKSVLQEFRGASTGSYGKLGYCGGLHQQLPLKENLMGCAAPEFPAPGHWERLGPHLSWRSCALPISKKTPRASWPAPADFSPSTLGSHSRTQCCAIQGKNFMSIFKLVSMAHGSQALLCWVLAVGCWQSFWIFRSE